MSSLPEYNARRIGFTAGVIAAAVMLAVIVVLRALSGAISLPEIIAEGLLVNMPGALFSAVLDALQHAAKPLFFLGVGIGILIVGGFLGRWYATRPSVASVLKIVLGVWVFFGIGVYTVLGAGMFGQHLAAGPIWHSVSLLLVFGVYGLALWHAFAFLAHRVDPVLPDISRRELLRNAAVGLVATLGVGSAWRLMMGGDTSGASAAQVSATAAPAAAVRPNVPP